MFLNPLHAWLGWAHNPQHAGKAFVLKGLNNSQVGGLPKNQFEFFSTFHQLLFRSSFSAPLARTIERLRAIIRDDLIDLGYSIPAATLPGAFQVS